MRLYSTRKRRLHKNGIHKPTVNETNAIREGIDSQNNEYPNALLRGSVRDRSLRCLYFVSVLGSIVGSNPACYAGDRDSIPRQGANLTWRC
ncbi:Uncharacterized protein FWK35_00018928 [Aphis craccivora]|uniref:Uncharacterized protein n=1 Tax=Aphis craccivora TaxID=307492 RepID=A0A6G0YH47_APHCR|nr:Uncharacterized protein FWK35_00018928 [Aphis craccivora]